ncbi:hypothetical protein UFOVP786_69 [uncultured Caudovirales phage]|uniref:Uncharacterized protein n=1 Tax=uncultured Caudovirales phage TaxID=2100421 RepID=A0A6J5NZL6_9CAUD|nr:hypothetical protein UFOVP786_69 [uncultured Caudovirales phage]
MTTVLDSDLAFGDTSAGSFSPSQFTLNGPVVTASVVVLTGEDLAKYQAIGINAAGKAVAWSPTATAQTGDTYANGTLTFGGQPTANDTVTLNGTAITFKASGATGAQVNIGATATLTATNLLTYITTNTVALGINAAQAGTVLTVEANAAGAVGNAITLAKSGTYPSLSDAHLTGGGDDTTVLAPEARLAGFMAQAVDADGADVEGPYFRSGTFNYDLIDWNSAVASLAAAQAYCSGSPLFVDQPK